MRLPAISAIVTGAAGGIGDPLCRRLVAGGARVLLVGRSAERLGRLASVLSRMPAAGRAGELDADLRHRVDVVAVDLTTPAGRHAVRAAAAARRANVLVHAAAVPSFGPLATLDDAHLAQLFQTDLLAPIALTRELLPVLQAAPEASILTIGSTLGVIGVPGFSAYGAAKAGVRAFDEALRRELRGSSVRVQYLSARATRTGFNDARVDQFNELTGTAVDTPDVVADAAIRLLQSGGRSRQLGWPERLFTRLDALVPGWLDGAFARHRQALESVSHRSPVDGSPVDATSVAATASPQTAPFTSH